MQSKIRNRRNRNTLLKGATQEEDQINSKDGGTLARKSQRNKIISFTREVSPATKSFKSIDSVNSTNDDT